MKDIACPVCGVALSVRIARGRRSNKPFLMLVCAKDGRHFRAFISDKGYLDRVLEGSQSIGIEEKGEGRGEGRPIRGKR